MSEKLDWMLVRGPTDKAIGAVGFIGNQAACFVSFYDDADWDEDGDISVAEKIGSFLPFFGREGRAITKVRFQAYLSNPDIAKRDPSIRQQSGLSLAQFGRALTLEGIYFVYFSHGVKMTGTGISKIVTQGAVKQFFVRKGFEKAVKEAFSQSVGI